MEIDQVITGYVEPDPTKPGAGDARLVGYGVPVWALISYLRLAAGDIDRVAADYALPVDAVRAAVTYYDRERAAIDVRIAANATNDAA